MAWFRVNLTEDEQRLVNAERESHPAAHVRRKLLVLWSRHCGLKPGQSHVKSRTKQDFLKMGIIPAGFEAFVFDADFGGPLVLQQAQRGPPQDAEVGVGVSFANAALVLLERHVELPVPPVLNAPMTAHRLCEPLRGDRFAEDVVPDFHAVLAVALRVADRHADGLQSRPAFPVGQVCGDRADPIVPRLFATVAVRVVPPDFGPHEIVLQVIVEEGHDPLVQRRLVPLHRQAVVGLLTHDLPGDLGLAAHGVDRHQGPRNLQHGVLCLGQQFRDRRDLVGLLVDHHLPEADGIGRGPRRDHVDR